MFHPGHEMFHLKHGIFHPEHEMFHLKHGIFHLEHEMFHLKHGIFHPEHETSQVKHEIFHVFGALKHQIGVATHQNGGNYTKSVRHRTKMVC